MFALGLGDDGAKCGPFSRGALGLFKGAQGVGVELEHGRNVFKSQSFGHWHWR